jgi:hypothetical protein
MITLKIDLWMVRFTVPSANGQDQTACLFVP